MFLWWIAPGRVQAGREDAGVTPLAEKRARVAPLGHAELTRFFSPGVASGSATKRIKAFDIRCLSAMCGAGVTLLAKKPQEPRRYAFGFLSVYLPGVAFGSFLKG